MDGPCGRDEVMLAMAECAVGVVVALMVLVVLVFTAVCGARITGSEVAERLPRKRGAL